MTDTKKRLEDAELAQALREKIAALSHSGPVDDGPGGYPGTG